MQIHTYKTTHQKKNERQTNVHTHREREKKTPREKKTKTQELENGERARQKSTHRFKTEKCEKRIHIQKSTTYT